MEYKKLRIKINFYSYDILIIWTNSYITSLTTIKRKFTETIAYFLKNIIIKRKGNYKILKMKNNDYRYTIIQLHLGECIIDTTFINRKTNFVRTSI